jgi:large subunit ribosomal protein L25
MEGDFSAVKLKECNIDMEIADLKVKERQETGTSICRKLRRQGLIPAVFYGEKMDSLSLMVEEREFRSLIKTHGASNPLVNLILDGPARKSKQTAMVHQIQKDPITQKVLHIDFHKISLTEKIQTTVPIEFVGEAVGVREGGVLQHNLRHVEVECLPIQIPEAFIVNVENLNIGDLMRVEDLPVIAGVEVLTDPHEIMVTITPPTELKEEEVAAAEEEEVPEPEVVRKEKEKVEGKGEKEEKKVKES